MRGLEARELDQVGARLLEEEGRRILAGVQRLVRREGLGRLGCDDSEGDRLRGEHPEAGRRVADVSIDVQAIGAQPVDGDEHHERGARGPRADVLSGRDRRTGKVAVGRQVQDRSADTSVGLDQAYGRQRDEDAQREGDHRLQRLGPGHGRLQGEPFVEHQLVGLEAPVEIVERGLRRRGIREAMDEDAERCEAVGHVGGAGILRLGRRRVVRGGGQIGERRIGERAPAGAFGVGGEGLDRRHLGGQPLEDLDAGGADRPAGGVYHVVDDLRVDVAAEHARHVRFGRQGQGLGPESGLQRGIGGGGQHRVDDLRRQRRGGCRPARAAGPHHRLAEEIVEDAPAVEEIGIEPCQCQPVGFALGEVEIHRG